LNRGSRSGCGTGPVLLGSSKPRGSAEGGARELFAGLAERKVCYAELTDGVGWRSLRVVVNVLVEARVAVLQLVHERVTDCIGVFNIEDLGVDVREIAAGIREGQIGRVEVVQVVDGTHRSDRGETVPGADIKVDAPVVEVIVESGGRTGAVIPGQLGGIGWSRNPLLHRLGDRRDVVRGNYVVGGNAIFETHKRAASVGDTAAAVVCRVEEEGRIVRSGPGETSSDGRIRT